MFQDKTSVYREPVRPASGQLLAANELPAPIAILSTAKRAALIACLKGGGTLHKRYGVWVSEATGSGDKPLWDDSCRPEPRWHVDFYRARQKRLSAAHHARKLVCSDSGGRNRMHSKTLRRQGGIKPSAPPAQLAPRFLRFNILQIRRPRRRW